MEVPPPTGDRFFVVTDDDQRGTLWVVSVICCAYILMIMVLRATARKGSFGIDDWLAAASTVTGFIQYIMIFVATSDGLGRSYADIASPQAEGIGKDILVANIFLLITLFLGKATVIYLCRRVFGSGTKNYLCDAGAGLCGVWCLASILAISIDCPSLEQIGYHTSFCTNMVTRWKAIGVVDAVTEALIVVLMIVFIRPVQMSWYRKIVIILHFVPRLLLILFIALHITNLESARNTTTRRSFFFSQSEVYLQVQVFYTIFSAAMPAVNRWLRAFDTSMGTTWTTSASYGASFDASGNKTSNLASNDIKMKVIRTRKNFKQSPNTTQAEAGGPRKELFRPDPVSYSASIRGQVDADAQSGQSQGSNHSQTNIIRKETHYLVHDEDHLST